MEETTTIPLSVLRKALETLEYEAHEGQGINCGLCELHEELVAYLPDEEVL